MVLTARVTYVTLAHMNSNIHEIGEALLRHSKETDFTAQRTVIDELFPFIYLASRRMSMRAISRWLAEAQGISLSVMAVTRAMQNAERHWRELAESIEPAARVFSKAHNVDVIELLTREELFYAFELKEPLLRANGQEEAEAAYDDYMHAASVLRSRWFAYPEEVRSECRRHLGALGARSSKRGAQHEQRSRQSKRTR